MLRFFWVSDRRRSPSALLILFLSREAVEKMKGHAPEIISHQSVKRRVKMDGFCLTVQVMAPRAWTWIMNKLDVAWSFSRCSCLWLAFGSGFREDVRRCVFYFLVQPGSTSFWTRLPGSVFHEKHFSVAYRSVNCGGAAGSNRVLGTADLHFLATLAEGSQPFLPRLLSIAELGA